MAALAARIVDVAHSSPAAAPAPRRAAAPASRGAAVCNAGVAAAAGAGVAAPAKQHNHHQQHHLLTRPPRQGRPRHSTVVRADFLEIDADSDSAPGGVAEGKFGPDAILMVGFTPDETRKWHKELVEIEAEFVRLVTCTKAMLKGTLGAAIETEQADAAAVAPAFGVARMMIFSGMVGGELLQLIDMFQETGMDRCIFACAVPNNWDTNVGELVEEIAQDHKMMAEQGKGLPQQAHE
mmetsp:Transcript_31406/g.78015  ORF Transcript_31406/g.78015 Transcript_31406/m.78015 type:complete len:237 (-) Transcript_31406:278-988(-)